MRVPLLAPAACWAVLALHFVATAALAQTATYELTSIAGLRPLNVTAEPATLSGKRGVRVTFSAEAKRRVAALPIAEQARTETFALIEGLEFSNGVIEAEISGDLAKDAPEGARGFVGIAFRVHPDMATYDAFYLRPTNGRADDQERRNHSAQYISHPDWPWDRLRRETPSRYESYVDIEPGVWTKIRIEVKGVRAKLFVNGARQPTLIVNDVKTGTGAWGGVALWINPGTVGHFRAVRVSP